MVLYTAIQGVASSRTEEQGKQRGRSPTTEWRISPLGRSGQETIHWLCSLSQELVWLMGGPRLPSVGSHVHSHAKGQALCLVTFDLARKRREWMCPLNRVGHILHLRPSSQIDRRPQIGWTQEHRQSRYRAKKEISLPSSVGLGTTLWC